MAFGHVTGNLDEGLDLQRHVAALAELNRDCLSFADEFGVAAFGAELLDDDILAEERHDLTGTYRRQLQFGSQLRHPIIYRARVAGRDDRDRRGWSRAFDLFLN